MSIGDRIEPYERNVALLDEISLHVHAADWIGPIEHDHLFPIPRARLHRVSHGPNERVVAGADILNIEDERV